jgi:hypothetical protein
MAQPKAQSAQAFVPIKEIRSGTVVLKDNSLRAVLIVSSLNFALKTSFSSSAMEWAKSKSKPPAIT